MSFQEQILSTLIGTISGFTFGIILFYITSRIDRGHKKKQLVENLMKETIYVLKHYLNQIALTKKWIDSEKYEIKKKLPFDILFRVRKPFLEKCFGEGVIYELLSEKDVYNLMSIESQIMYEDEDIRNSGYSLGGDSQEEIRKYHEALLQTRLKYCQIIKKLIEKCENF